METGAVRPYGTIAHEPPPRRDDVAGSSVATDLPTTKTVRAPQAADGGTAADNRRRDQERAATAAVKTGFERDLDSGSIVYRWIDQTTEKVILEIPRSDKIRSRHLYQDAATSDEAHPSLDRSV